MTEFEEVARIIREAHEELHRDMKKPLPSEVESQRLDLVERVGAFYLAWNESRQEPSLFRRSLDLLKECHEFLRRK